MWAFSFLKVPMNVKTPRFEILTLTGEKWENTGTVEVEGNKTIKEFFTSREDAQAELDEHFEDMEEANMDFDRDDYMIVQVNL